LKVITTSSAEAVHGLFDIVQRKIYVELETPVNVEVEFVGVVIEPPVPLTIVQSPVPTVGVLPARVTDITPPDEEAF
jgi:hypothetical protein